MTRTLPLRDSDLQAWRKLVATARAAAARKPYSVDAFGRAGERAFKSRLPDPNDVEGRKPFLALIGFARTWPRLDLVGKAENAEPLQALARRVAVVLGDEEAADDGVAAPSAARRLPYHDDSFDEEAA